MMIKAALVIIKNYFERCCFRLTKSILLLLDEKHSGKKYQF